MNEPSRKAVRAHRRRLREKGLTRVEVYARASDTALIRELAKALRAEGEATDTLRRKLKRALAPQATGLKRLLAEAPLEGVRITRSRDRGRMVDL